jgi:predicted outer membrane repeat protein
MNQELINSPKPITKAARRAWLASLLLRRDSRLLPRLAYHYERLRALPRPIKRRLRRQLAVTLAGAALLLALGRAPAMPATIDVFAGETEFANNGRCSLHEAIVNANQINPNLMHDDCAPGNPAGADTVVLPAGSQFNLLEAYDHLFGSYTALPPITSPVTIEGHGATIQRPAGAGEVFRLLAVAPTGNLTLVDVNLRGGATSEAFAAGGAVYSQGFLTVDGGALRDNAAGLGGAIGNRGVLSIEGATFLNNTAERGGAIFSSGEDSPLPGGGLLTLVASQLSGNEAVASSGGGLYVEVGSVTISRAVFDDNKAAYLGGGAAITRASLSIEATTFSNNEAQGGGGLWGSHGNLGIKTTTISGNSAIFGGGLRLEQADATLANSTVSGNVASYGGGLFNAEANTTITNSTFTTNYAYYTGGGIYSIGGAPTLGLARSLISGNEAPGGGREVFIFHGVVAAGAYNLFGFNGDAGVYGFSPGGNDVIPVAGVSAAAVVNATPADHGGPTRTNALPPGSPAIDAARSANCADAPINGLDQRGLPRNADGDGAPSTRECDIGAYELQLQPAVDHTLFMPSVVR